MATSSEIMANDLEKAQRARFAKAKDPYLFFADDAEAEVYSDIQDLRAAAKRENAPLHTRRRVPGLRGRRPGGYAPEYDD